MMIAMRETAKIQKGWDPKRPNNVYPTQSACAPCDDGKRGHLEPQLVVYDREGRVVDRGYVHGMNVNPHEDVLKQ